jgi:2-oxoglutarate dehydrogenase E1 component
MTGLANAAPTLRAIDPSVNGWNAEYLESQYQSFRRDPASVPADMRQFFAGFDLAVARGDGPASAPAGGENPIYKGVANLVQAYRARGHMAAKLDPLQRNRERPRDLDPVTHGIHASDLDKVVDAAVFGISGGSTTVRELIARYEAIYCGSLGFEFHHISDKDQRDWFVRRIEGGQVPVRFDAATQRLILEYTTQAESFDKFLGKRYQGKKRFSIEGSESLIPLLKFFTQRAGELGTQEIILGMPHRGRLSVLKNYLGKDLGKIFTEFEDSWTEGGAQGGGDVKYHRGYSGDQPLRAPASGSVHLSMLNNPSHLEAVNPVVMGRCRAKQDMFGDAERRRCISVLLHGDAAVIGQGVVAECLNMSQLEGYSVGGTVHVVVNNQVGFTTDPSDARSTPYCTDIGKIVSSPVLHVNADDVEAVVFAAMLAAEYRHEFRRDIFIDLVTFRRYGHNEQDEPSYTQPILTQLIKEHPGTLELYRKRLIASGSVSTEAADAMLEGELAALDVAQNAAKNQPVNPVPPPGKGAWEGIGATYNFDSPATAISERTLRSVCDAYANTPAGFTPNAKIKQLLANRAALPTTKKLSHADAEQLAFGTLALEGIPVRLSGQDCRRGTFTQRHATLRDEKTGAKWTPLDTIRDGQARVHVWDSPLSEYAVMGFDYGYSRAYPRTLVMWEGQFGDFVNGAQVMIDQFLASSEVKWSRWAGLVLLLPHGYEGQGPEHSSARLERFLQLCANENMEVVYPSTGAQTFHMLRRQALRNFRKPLIVMTPKKFLRVETSTTDELLSGGFQHAIDDTALRSAADAKQVSRVIYCTGKVYHELADRRALLAKKDVAIVRVEQLYPLHLDAIRAIDARYPKQAQRVWVQEEPRNQGAYTFIADEFREKLGIELGGERFIGRVACASPATGSEYAHKHEQEAILTAAIGPAPGAADAKKKK